MTYMAIQIQDLILARKSQYLPMLFSHHRSYQIVCISHTFFAHFDRSNLVKHQFYTIYFPKQVMCHTDII